MVKISSPLSSSFSLEWLVASSVLFGCPFCCHSWWPVSRGPAHLWIQSLLPGSTLSRVFASDSTSWLVSLSMEEWNVGFTILPPACFHLFSDFYLRQLYCGVSASWTWCRESQGVCGGSSVRREAGEQMTFSWDLWLSTDSLVLNFFWGTAAAWCCHSL